MKYRNPFNRGLARHSSIWTGLCTITFCALTAGQSMAQLIWTGGVGSTWDESGNWTDGTNPNIPDLLTPLTFSGSPVNGPTNNDFPALITGDISFTNAGPSGTAPNNVTSAFTLGGNAITLGGNIGTSAVQATGAGGIDITDTIGMNVVLNGTRTINTSRQGGTGGNRVSHNLDISGQITESGGSFGLTKAGDANLTLSNVTNSFTGALQINGAGAVVATSLEPSGTASSIGSGSAINFTNNSATLRFAGSVAPSAAINRSINLNSTGSAGGSLDNSGSVPVTFNGAFTNTGSGAKSFTLTGSNTGANVLSSNLVNGDTGGVLGFTKAGAGAWTLSGASTFTGNVLIDNGTLRVSTIGEVGSSNLGLGTLVQIGNSSRSGVLDYTGTGSITGRQVKLGGFVGATGSGNPTILASATSGTSTGLKFTATNFNAAEGTTPASPITRVLTLGGDNTDANEISGAITDGNASVTTVLNKTGAGLWILSGQNSYTGVGTVAGGVTGSTIVGGGTLQVNQATNGLGNSTASNAINLNGGTLSLRNDGAGNNGTITVGSAANPSGYNVQLTTSNSTINVANLTANTGNTIALGPLTQATASVRTLNVTGANGYSLTLPSLGLSPGTGNNTTLNPTTASITIAGNVTNPMTGFGNGNFDTLTLSGTSTGNRIQGVISDATPIPEFPLGGLTRVTKIGTSTWELNGNNTNDGLMSVNGGTLLINGDSSGATGAVTVSSGVLGGTGIIGGSINVTADGSLSPGANSVGTLTCAALSLGVMADAGGTGALIFELGPIASSDKIVVTGGLALGGGVLGVSDFNFSALAGLTNGTYPLITGATGVTGTLNAGDLTGLIGGGKQGELQLSGNDLVLLVSDAGADPYADWADGAPFDGDANSDGVEDGLAWFLGAATPSTNATGLLPKSSQTAGALVLEFDCLDAAARGAALFQVEYSNNLTAWAGTDVPGTVGTFAAGVVDFVVTDPAPTGGLLKIVATIPVGEATAGKLFGRLNGVK